MKRTYLGEFEEIVLLTVAILQDKAYGVSITEEIEQQTGRSVSVSAVHAALHRLEEKGMVSSWMGEATAERGGRRKRMFVVSALGNRTLDEIRLLRNRMWEAIPLHIFSTLPV
ncbi:PadR family transcriptional regulator [Emticicia sp. 17c]|uniref:PadR family transcriptional regulator n=1 Tax=Emticicia sp. 17c TaxID=3127704 RepID=UPI00301C0582